MTKPPRDPKAKPDATDPKSRAEHIEEAQGVIDDAREQLADMDRREDERFERRERELAKRDEEE